MSLSIPCSYTFPQSLESAFTTPWVLSLGEAQELISGSKLAKVRPSLPPWMAAVICSLLGRLSASFSIQFFSPALTVLMASTADQLWRAAACSPLGSARAPQSCKEQKGVNMSRSPILLAGTQKVLRVLRTSLPYGSPQQLVLGLFYLARDSLVISQFVFQENFYMGAN